MTAQRWDPETCTSAKRLSPARPSVGVARYSKHPEYWNTMLDPADRVTIFTRDAYDPRTLGLSAAFTNRVVQPALTNALWENLLLPRAARDVDVLFGPSYTLPLFGRGRSVVTIHSVDEAAGVHSLWHRLTYTQKYKFSARRADMVITNLAVDERSRARRYGIRGASYRRLAGSDDAFRLDDETRLRPPGCGAGADRPYSFLPAACRAGGMCRAHRGSAS